MAFYDNLLSPLGIGGETEEERKKRLLREQQAAEPANTVVHTQQTTTYGDGSQTETTKREIPAPVSPEQIQPPVQQQMPAAAPGRYSR